MSKLQIKGTAQESGDVYLCSDGQDLSVELEALREEARFALDRLATTTATLSAVQNERRTLLLVLDTLAKMHEDLGPVIEDLKLQFECHSGDGWVPYEEYEELARENEDLRMQLASQPHECAQVQEVNLNLQMEMMRLTAENIALKAGAEKREAEREARGVVERRLFNQAAVRQTAGRQQRPHSRLVHQFSLALDMSAYDQPAQLSEVPLPAPTLLSSAMPQAPNGSVAPASGHGESTHARKKELLGAFAYNAEDEDELIEKAIGAVQPLELAGHTPGLIGHVLFMVVRYLDHTNNATGLQSFLKKAIAAIQDVIKTQRSKGVAYPDLDVLVFWLAACCRLLSDMKQYSGDPMYACAARPGQEPLRNFDLTEYRRVLGDLCIMIHKLLLRVLQEEVGPLAEAVLLYHEGLAAQPMANTPASDDDKRETVETLVQWFEEVKSIFGQHCLSPEITDQTISELVSYCLGLCFNILLTSPELCTDLKALQITFNVQQFHDWFRNDDRVASRRMLAMLMEATNILQLPKQTAENIELICATCKVTPVSAIQQLLVMYTNEKGEHIPAAVLEEGLRKKWEEVHARVEAPHPLLVDLTRTPPISIPYTPKDILLADIALPDCLGLDMLRKI